MTNRRDVMSDTQGEQQLIEEYVANLVDRSESLVDTAGELEDELEGATRLVDSLEARIEELEDKLAWMTEDRDEWEQAYRDRDGV